ncbi:hypothetical protein KAS08_03450 [Candidatus Pacearchaeota archaeon]|nr:hypothetical protein [Candidatus Pacearchaeota archaeon]
MKNKRGDVDKSILVQIILVVLVFTMFLGVTAKKIDGRGVRQDIIESQIAMAIEAGVPGMSFEISKINVNGIINKVNIEGGKIFISIDGLSSFEGHSYFSRYDVKVIDEKGKFLVVIS